MSYSVGVLSGVGDISLLICLQVFSLLKVRFRGISESHKSLIQKKKKNSLINNIDIDKVTMRGGLRVYKD